MTAWKRTLACLVVLGTMGGVARGQTVVHAGGGISIARSPHLIADAPVDLEFGGGIGTFIGPFVTVRAFFDVSWFNVDAAAVRDELELPEGVVEAGGARAMALLLDVKLNTPALGTLSPYVVGSLGGVRYVEREVEVTVEDGAPVRLDGRTQAGPAASVAAGINMVLSSRIALFAEARYITGWGGAEGVTYIPVRLGIAVR